MLGNKEVARLWFVDDLTLGARSRPEVEHALDALRERLQGHPAGPVLLDVDPPTSVEHGPVKVFGYVLQPGRGYGDSFVHVFPGRERFGRFHKKLYERWKAAGEASGDAMEDLILERLRHWMPSQQAWTVIPMDSLNLALSCAVAYVCDKEREEPSQTTLRSAPPAAPGKLGTQTLVRHLQLEGLRRGGSLYCRDSPVCHGDETSTCRR